MSRPKIGDMYLENMTLFLQQSMGISKEEAQTFVKDVAKERFKDRKVVSQHCPVYGDKELKEGSLYGLIEKHKDDVITPSGSIYISAGKKRCSLSMLVRDKMAERKFCKKEQLKAEAAGDAVATRRWHYKQTSIKITTNSLPGGFGSEFNIFYDKGGYNSITSLARSLIATAYTTAEQLLGGNFAWFCQDDIVTYLVLMMKHVPDKSKVLDILNRFGLKQPTREELFAFIRKSAARYQCRDFNTSMVERIVRNMDPATVAFVYYGFNLPHLLQENQHVTKTWIDSMLDVLNLPIDQNVKPDDLFKLDGDLVAMVTPVIHDRLNKMQPYDLPKKDTDLAKWYVTVANHIQRHLNMWKEVFETFIFVSIDIPRVNMKKHAVRNTVIISDTDSVIFTAKNWVRWYTGNLVANTKAYAMTSLAIYWLSKVVAHELKKYSIKYGAIKEDLGTMKMKNEFLYPALILFDIKKVYAGVVTIQEGVVLPKPKPDIKGGSLRSSGIAKASTKFVKDLIVDSILTPAITGTINGSEVVHKVCTFENRIKNSIKNGEFEFLEMKSIRTEDNYAKPLVSAYFYYMAWEEIFAPKYGKINLPSKAPCIQLERPTSDYLQYLEEKFPDTYKRWVEFINKYKKIPGYIVFNPMLTAIPEELRALVAVREIIFKNLKPVYLTLERLNLGIGFEKQKLVMSDIYF